MIVPSFDTINQRVASETQPNEVNNVSSQNGKVNMKKQKEKKLKQQEFFNLTRSFTENDPTEKLLSFLASENERSQRNEAEMMRMMLQINNPVHYNQAHSTQMFRNAYYQDREGNLFNRSTYAPQFEPTVPQLNESETSSSGLENMSMLILRTQHLLLMTPPSLHTNHLISNYWSEKHISYFIFIFVTLFALSLYGCKHLRKAGGMEMMDL